eukprot:2479276-Ditylum_brightwellii.AAC.2
MANPFNPAAPIKDLFEQINDDQDRIHNYACRKWNRKPANQKTFTNLQMHFTQTQQELYQLQSAARQAGYTANNVLPKEQEEEEIQNRTVAGPKKLEDTTTHDCTAVTNLSISNTE